ncbi:MAG: DUF5655 domain-containing protein [Bacteroidota bacterium]
MWICPKCKRPFKSRNQWHSCVRVDPDSIFDRFPLAEGLYKKLVKKIRGFGPDVMISAAKSCVFAKAPGTFIAFKPKKDHLLLEFFLSKAVEEFPVEKTFRYSRTKVVHWVRIDGKEQINAQLLRWLRESYRISRQ